MTINELIERLNELQAGGDMTLAIHAMGGMRGGKNIKSVSLGFDWDMGKVLLHPDPELHIAKPDTSLKDKKIAEQYAELTKLRAELDAARKALKPFADAADSLRPTDGDSLCINVCFSGKPLYVGDLRSARSALKGGE